MKQIFKYAFKQTVPVLLGYLFLGAAFGLLLDQAGYGVLWALGISLCVYSGSMQFVLVTFLSAGGSLVSMALITLSVNSRHIFYGLSFIEKFKAMGKRIWYMIFALTDETYSLLCSTKCPEDMDEKKLHFAIALLNHGYWVLGSAVGGILGQLLSFNTTGVDFAMTALFVVIFVEQWQAAKSHIPAIIGLACGIVALLVLGPNNFILPAMIAAAVLLILGRVQISLSHDT